MHLSITKNGARPMSVKTFASAADLEVKQVSFDKLSEHAYAYTAEGDPNTGIVIGDDAVMVIDTQATPVMAQDVIRRIREVTDIWTFARDVTSGNPNWRLVATQAAS